MANLADLITGISFVGAPIYLGIAYLVGKWPFTKIEENVFQITRYFTGHKGPALKGPGPELYIKPFIKKITDSQGKVVTFSRKEKARDSKLRFRTNDNDEGGQKIQYNYFIPDKYCAKRFYWELENMKLIDDLVHARISQEIGKRDADDLPKEQAKYLNGVQKELGQKNNKNVLYKKYGVVITSIVGGPLDFDENSQRILSIVQEAKKEAEAKVILAQAEATAIEIQVETTKKMFDSYVEIARNLLQQAKILPSDPDYNDRLFKQVNELNRQDTLETMARSGATFLHNSDKKKE
jgi:regulator of protease activity HflC (stomatin/prohibitin superfamily)